MTNETIPQRVRRTAREYAKQFFPHWNVETRGKVQFAWERGFWASHNDFAAKAQLISDAIDAWEAGGDAEALVAILDEQLEEIFDYNDRSAA